VARNYHWMWTGCIGRCRDPYSSRPLNCEVLDETCSFEELDASTPNLEEGGRRVFHDIKSRSDDPNPSTKFNCVARPVAAAP
jgi:hypothetical protein